MIVAVLVALAPALIVLLTIGALISAAETSMTAASRARLHQLEREGDRAAARVNKLIGNQENLIGAILLSNNVVNILASAVTTAVLSAVLPGALGVVIATVVMTVLIVIFGEILPKTLAITRPEVVARALALPTYWIVRHTLRPFGVKLSMEMDVLAAHEEIRGTVDYHHSEGLVETGDRYMLGGVLDLAELDVSDVMVHRKNMYMLDAGQPVRDVVSEALDAPHTRLPLYQDDPENIVGVLHARDLLRALAAHEGRIEGIDVMAIAREPWFIPETTNLKDQLNAFLKRRSHFALVVDEYGALQGLVTLEDILEEIVGEIEDEHDPAIQGLQREPDGSVTVDGSVTIRDLNRAMNWELPDDEAVTVAGLVIHEAQTIPDADQTFIFHGHRFQVVRRRRNQITSLRVSPRL